MERDIEIEINDNLESLINKIAYVVKTFEEENPGYAVLFNNPKDMPLLSFAIDIDLVKRTKPVERGSDTYTPSLMNMEERRKILNDRTESDVCP